MYSNDLILDIVGSEQEYATFSFIDEFQGQKHQKDVHNNIYHIQTSPGYDEKDFRSFSESKSGFGVKKVDSAASYRELFQLVAKCGFHYRLKKIASY